MEKAVLPIRNIRKSVLTKMIQLKKLFFLDLNKDFKNSIFLSGDARSGTTWVPNIINYKNDFRYMFEPFHPSHIKICNKFKFYQYLRTTDDRKYFVNTASRILSGQVRHHRIDRFNSRFFYSKRLIKDIFGNLFLRWIKEFFPDVKIILLLRHPCAVANSKLRLRHWSWPENPEEFLEQQDLVDDFLYPFIDDIKSAEGFFEKQIFIWCILHYVPLRQFKADQIHLAFYENFCEQPEKEIRRLFTFLGERLGETLDSRVYQKINQPSGSIQKWSALTSDHSLIDKWRKDVTDSQINRTIQILKKFKLDTIYSENSMPNVDGAYDLLKKG